MLERQADPGSAHWVQQLESGRMTTREVVHAIATSPEYMQRFIYTEAGESTPYERSVARLYRHILGRQPDAEGQRSFALLAQRSGPRPVVERILNSREYNEQFGDWGVPGSGGLTYCGSSNQAANQSAVAPAVVTPENQRRFRAMDRNNDGYISRDEARDASWANRFSELDKDNDGRLSRSEFDAMGAGAAGATVNKDAGSPTGGMSDKPGQKQ